MRYLFTLFIFSIFFQVKAQLNTANFNFKDSLVNIGMSLKIEALEYTNDLDKYNFDKKRIDSLAYFLKKNHLVKIEVSCNSDYSESPLLSMMATAEQAELIRLHLVKKGIKGTRIETYGNGEMNLLISENDKTYMDVEGQKKANKKNRRIDITIIDLKEEITSPSKGVKSYPH